MTSQFERDHNAKAIKGIRKILRQDTHVSDDMASELHWMSQQDRNLMEYGPWVVFFIIFALAFSLVIIGCSPAHAEVIEGHDIQVWANAINKAENSKNHPYGILANYKHTTPRQACINTVRHQYRLWCKNSCNKPFLAFLASKYAPLQASNDPFHLNNNWERNVSWFLTKGV